MAELDTSGGGKHKGGKVRTKKKNTRVDLTAMVDLAFLLITFFILTTTLSKPKAMELVMPDKSDTTKQLAVPESRTMTLLLGSNDKLEWFVGEPGKSKPSVIGYSDLRKTLVEQDKLIKDSHGGQGMIVIVSPSDKSTYKNVVTVMDELNITNIDQRAIVKILPVDIDLLKRDNLY
ncbi:outer membrane transport energization protein ExbD [Mucilaginibacter mallensis]|uniref:Outer membrane transport energization protein ExbD n=1 Tax=Mucilaginibacter mallensis TaxID=652787 RepID=A0A1H1NDE7_MUCMA|nr:biopolymer transporter ExbD [Mucilaginibacter mallensis]SDR96429.1 outer membrane transport energization protein ExbD [Mucilaginibacter mallensis]